MLTFKWGVPNGKDSVRFWDGVAKSMYVDEHEVLYGVDGDTVSAILWEVDEFCPCKTVEVDGGVAASAGSGRILMDMPIGVDVLIPDALVKYAAEKDEKIRYDCTHYHKVVYAYGVFNGRNRVIFNHALLTSPAYYDMKEAIYRLVDGVVSGRVEWLGTTDCCRTKTVDGRVWDTTKPKLELKAPSGCDVKIPRKVRFAMEDFGDETALFVPVHANGEVDWLNPEESDLVRKSIEEAYNKCKHLTGRERFVAMMPYLKGVEIFCLGELVEEVPDGLDIVDCYGVEVPCRVQYSRKEDARYNVYFKDGKSLMLTSSADYPNDLILDSDFTVMGEKVYITDRPIEKGTLIKTTLGNMFGDVALIEVPPEVAVSGFDILPELERMLKDEAYRSAVAADIQQVFMKLPPSQRNEKEAIRQVCEFARAVSR